MTMPRKIKPRTDIAQNWAVENPVLEKNELAIESDTNKIKIGNGVNVWNDLNYFISTLPVQVPAYTVVSSPDPAQYQGAWIFVTNETGGAVMAFSDGTNWRRCTDRAIITA